MENTVLIKIKDAKIEYPFSLFDDNVVKIEIADVEIYVKYFEQDDSFIVFDGGFTIVECIERFGDSEKIFKKVQKVLEKYEVNKDEGKEPLYLECDASSLKENIDKLISAELEILGV